MDTNTGIYKIINKQLSLFGRRPDRKTPIYRLVWSESQTEVRQGVFNEFSGNLFLRQVVGTKEVPKYPYIKERFILEKWAAPEVAATLELPMSGYEGSYEPLYVFESKSGDALAPTLKVCEFLVSLNMRALRRSPSDRLNDLLHQEDVEVQDFMDQIDTSPIGNALHLRQAVGYTKGLKQ